MRLWARCTAWVDAPRNADSVAGSKLCGRATRPHIGARPPERVLLRRLRARARAAAAMPRPAPPVTRSSLCAVVPAPTPLAACAGDPAAPATPPEAVDAISELPDVLLQILLRALIDSGGASWRAAEASATALVRLAACSAHLRRAVAALDDDAWLVRAVAGPQAPLSRVRLDPKSVAERYAFAAGLRPARPLKRRGAEALRRALRSRW